MGFLRGALVTVIGVALLVSLFVMNSTLTLTWSLEYETLKPTIKNVVGDFSQEEFGLDQTILAMQEYCVNETEFVFSQDGTTFVIPCEVINQGSEAVLDYGLDSLVEQIYYAEYECEFWDCVKTSDDFLVLISEKAHDYWKSKFMMFFLISVGLFLLMFLVANRKSNAFILAGLLTIISSLPFMKLTWIARFVPEALKEIFLSFFARSNNVFIIVVIVGLFLFGLGMVFHFLKWGLKISKLFRKHAEEQDAKEDVKEIVKKEIAASKQALGSSASEKEKQTKEKIKQTVKKELAVSKTKNIEKQPIVKKKSASTQSSKLKKPIIGKPAKPPIKPVKSIKK